MKKIDPARPHAILMVGISGAGKTYFASQFADSFKALYLNLTDLRNKFDLSSSKASSLGQIILGEYFKSSRTVIVETSASSKEQRQELIKKFIKAGFNPLIVWVQTDTAEAKRRATSPYPKGSGLTSDEFNDALDEFQPPDLRENAIVISGKHTFKSQLKIVLKQIANRLDR